MGNRAFKAALLLVLLFSSTGVGSAGAQATKLVVAYSSAAATLSPGWITKRERLFAKHHLDVEMVSMQGPSTYMPALAGGNIQIMYGGGTVISRAHHLSPTSGGRLYLPSQWDGCRMFGEFFSTI